MSDTTALRARLERAAEWIEQLRMLTTKDEAWPLLCDERLSDAHDTVREAIAALALPADVVFTCSRCGEKGNPPRCDHFAQAWTPAEIAEAHAKLTAAAPAPEGLDIRRMDTPENRAYWEFVGRTAHEGRRTRPSWAGGPEPCPDGCKYCAEDALRVRPALSDDRGYLRVQGRCPSCGSDSLFLGSKGYVTCSVLGCKDPGAATDVLRPALSDETLREMAAAEMSDGWPEDDCEQRLLRFARAVLARQQEQPK